MLARLIDFHLANRALVLAGLLLLVVGGVKVVLDTPVEAFPDLTNNQVVVITECPAMAPTEVEQLVTFPLESAVMGIPRTQQIRSISKLGLSMVTIIFDDEVNPWFARQLVNERLQQARDRLPSGLAPTLGPMATAFGEVFQYTMEGPGRSPMELKTIHDWQVRHALRTVPGVNEVNSWGGETKTYTVEVDPSRLQRYSLNLRDVFERIRENNANFGGGFIEHAMEQYTVRGLGRANSTSDLGQIVLRAHTGTPVRVRDVANVAEEPLPRQGATTRNGTGEVVSGMAIMLKGENGRRVIERVRAKLASLRLPDGVKVVPFYDQSTVIDGTVATVQTALLEGALLVGVVLYLFLGNFRAALIVGAIIPLSLLFSFFGMRIAGISGNLMSLGAIDFGMIVDGAVVMMEAAIAKMVIETQSHHRVLSITDRIREAAHESARPVLFAVLIIIAVYLPVFFLEGLEARMFRPMAISVCCALLGGLFLTLTALPAATAMVLGKGVKPHKDAWFHWLQHRYTHLLRAALRRRLITVSVGALVALLAVPAFLTIGTEFMARLDEGSILIETRKLPGISLPESVALSTRIEQIILKVPEVREVVTRLGRPDVATEAMGIYQGDVYVLLKPREEWRFDNKEQLIEAIDRAVSNVPGVSFNFTQPMAMRLDETISGIKADVALKIFGEDPAVLTALAEKALRIVSQVPGSADAQMEIISGVGELRVEVSRDSIARYGLNISDTADLMDAAIGGKKISEMVEGNRRFDVLVRLPPAYRKDDEAVRNLLLFAPGGERVPLGAVARVKMSRGPEVVSRENGQRRIVVQANVRGRDLGGFVHDAQSRIGAELSLPAGYSLDWGGQFENQERATARLLIILPVSILLIFGLLFMTFQSTRLALLILMNLPFALTGGLAALHLRGLNLNISAGIGFIALFGVSVLSGIVIVSHIRRLCLEGVALPLAIVRGASERLRPVLMAALVAGLGFVPMALARSAGAEVQRPLATVVIGGLIVSTPMMLFLLPVIYPFFDPHRARRRAGE